MRENQVTAENKEKMMQCHFGTLESRRKWILEKKPTVTDILTRFPRFTSLKGAVDCDLKFVEGWRTEEFTERWKKIEKSLAVELLKKHGESLGPFAELTMDLVDSYENSLLGLDTANDRKLIIFSSLPILFPPRPSRASKGFTLPNLKNISQIFVRRFPVGTNLSEALQRCETNGMIQPGLIVIGNRRYIKADLIPIKINTPSAAESIAILFAVYHIFNLIFPDNLNLVYIFLQNMMEHGREKEALPNNKKKKTCKSLVVNDFSLKILQLLKPE
ncbi:uncharacterized protein LOC123475913 [Daphnia magna]|uniref:uncharacterized protein LOC123475913 n=1 Tax=Daphnia magna TaxID=35525 RepID=UPI001E1BB609|nr:uncharacterized protein LOC123475913 [Daphnia magna]